MVLSATFLQENVQTNEELKTAFFHWQRIKMLDMMYKLQCYEEQP